MFLGSKYMESRIVPNYSWEEGEKLPIFCNHKAFHLGHCRFLDTLGGLLLVSSLQIQDRHQMLKAAFEFCLCNSELSSAFSSPLISNTTSDVLTVSTLPAFPCETSVSTGTSLELRVREAHVYLELIKHKNTTFLLVSGSDNKTAS